LRWIISIKINSASFLECDYSNFIRFNRLFKFKEKPHIQEETFPVLNAYNHIPIQYELQSAVRHQLRPCLILFHRALSFVQQQCNQPNQQRPTRTNQLLPVSLCQRIDSASGLCHALHQHCHGAV
jgi:hypothetical protein